ncbi:hypothetical protein CDCA_CDCA10G2899 [Cyanidium caldarium]|uniref:Uncharacterized protein n=1 Tax=Cyanidium caldarium TaxID=2771 RepID=A0AAV9IX61_CYACA|nr:hypothetical protein CDCA_CDCA10G2899 [Cyanidium caldarium]
MRRRPGEVVDHSDRRRSDPSGACHLVPTLRSPTRAVHNANVYLSTSSTSSCVDWTTGCTLYRHRAWRCPVLDLKGPPVSRCAPMAERDRRIASVPPFCGSACGMRKVRCARACAWAILDAVGAGGRAPVCVCVHAGRDAPSARPTLSEWGMLLVFSG